MSNTTTSEAPEVRQAVQVRKRLATVRAVEPYDSRDVQGRLNLVEVEYLDDCCHPETGQVLWEVEASAKVLGVTSSPSIDAHRPDGPTALRAFVNAHRWTRLNRLRETAEIEDEPLLGVWNSATHATGPSGDAAGNGDAAAFAQHRRSDEPGGFDAVGSPAP